jgi:hypothetical protein
MWTFFQAHPMQPPNKRLEPARRMIKGMKSSSSTPRRSGAVR